MPGEDAVASTTTFVIALGLFMAAFAGVLLATSEVGQDTDTPDAAADRAGAEALADILLGLSLIHIRRCRRSTLCRSRWSPYH